MHKSAYDWAIALVLFLYNSLIIKQIDFNLQYSCDQYDHFLKLFLSSFLIDFRSVSSVSLKKNTNPMHKSANDWVIALVLFLYNSLIIKKIDF